LLRNKPDETGPVHIITKEQGRNCFLTQCKHTACTD